MPTQARRQFIDKAGAPVIDSLPWGPLGPLRDRAGSASGQREEADQWEDLPEFWPRWPSWFSASPRAAPVIRQGGRSAARAISSAPGAGWRRTRLTPS